MLKRINQMLFARHLEDDEEILMIVHKHWLIGLKFVFWPSVSIVVSWYILYLVPLRGMFYLIVLWSIFSVVWWIRNFFDHYLDAWIIMSEGIIDVEWHGWFHRESTRVLYSDVQGVSYEIDGIVGTFLRFGEVTVEKVSSGNTISLEYVSRPRRVEKEILKNMEGYLHTKNLKDAKTVQEVLAQMIANEMQLQGIQDDDDASTENK